MHFSDHKVKETQGYYQKLIIIGNRSINLALDAKYFLGWTY